MSKKTLLSITLLSITLALIMTMAPACYAQEASSNVTIRLMHYNGTVTIPLANEVVTIRIVDATNATNFKQITGATNSTGYITITDIPIAPTRSVNVTVWWNATSWGVSYLVNYTSQISLQNLNTTSLICSIYNVRLSPVDSANNSLPYAIVRILDVNATRMMYDVSAGPEGVTEELKIPAPIDTTTLQPRTDYYIRITVYWTPTTPVGMIPVYNGLQSAQEWANYIDGNYTVIIPCSVYYVTAQILDVRGLPVSSKGDLFVFACIYANGTLMSTQARVENGMATIRVATIEGQLSDYEFRVYWRWNAPSIEYLVYVNKSEFGTISGNVAWPRNVITNTVYGSIMLLDKSGSPLSLANAEIAFPIYNYVFSTDTMSTGLDGCVDWSPIIGTWWMQQPPPQQPRFYSDVMLLPIKHNGTELVFGIKATFEGVKVLETTFRPAGYSGWGNHPWYNIPMLNLTCNVCWVSLKLTDAYGKPLKGNALLTINYPAEGASVTFIVVNGSAGRNLPGGSGLTAAIDYKDVEGLPSLAPKTFDITEATTSVTLRFPVYNLVVYVYDWYGKVKLENFNCTTVFTKGLWKGVIQEATYNATDKSHVFEQMPRGGTYAINVSIKSTTSGFERVAPGTLLARTTVTMPDGDYVASVKIPLYNPTFVVKAADGSDVPTALANLTYIVVQANTSNASPIFVNNTVNITYTSNQTLGVCFMGGWVYPVRVYIAGVLVYDGAVKLPDPAVTETVTLRVNLYSPTIKVLTYDGKYPVPKVNVSYGWTGLNVTNFSAQDLLTSGWSEFFTNFTGVSENPPNVTAYRASVVTDVNGTARLWVPVWNLTGLNYTTIVYGVYTMPGVTGGVPSTAPVKQVAPWNDTWIGIMGTLVNVTATRDIGDVRVYAYNFFVKVYDYLGRPIAGYVVQVNATYGVTPIDVSKTDVNGTAAFISGAKGLFFFSNYSYVVYVFMDKPADVPAEMWYPQIICNGTALLADWPQNREVVLRFPGALLVKALDWEGNPLAGATVKMFWSNGTWAGRLTAVASTDKSGTATIPMSDTTSIYTIEVWWKGSIVNREYRLEEQFMFPPGVTVFSYTERMLVFSPRITFVSDLGTALPAGIDVEVMLPDGSMIRDKTDVTGSVLLVQVPIGKYTVVASWDGVSICYSELWISSDAPWTLKTSVYEVTLKVLTKKGTPLAKATIDFIYPSRKPGTVSLDLNGESPKLFVAASKLVNELKIERVTWEGIPIKLDKAKVEVTASETVTFYATNIYTLKVSVVGALQQLLDGASVVILKDGKVVASTVAKGGVAEVELPEGNYTVQASYLGKRGETSVTLTQDADAKIALDVFMVIGNQAFSMSEVILWIIMAIVLIIVLAVIIIALTRIRRRAAPSPAETTVKTQ